MLGPLGSGSRACTGEPEAPMIHVWVCVEYSRFPAIGLSGTRLRGFELRSFGVSIFCRGLRFRG